MSLEVAIYTIAKAHAGLTALIGAGDSCRLYLVIGAQKDASPFVTYRVISHQPAEAMGVVSTLRARRVEFQIHSTAQADILTVSAQLRDCFERYAGTAGGHTIQDCTLDNETDLGLDLGPKTYRRALDFLFWSES